MVAMLEKKKQLSAKFHDWTCKKEKRKTKLTHTEISCFIVSCFFQFIILFYKTHYQLMERENYVCKKNRFYFNKNNLALNFH